MVNGTRYICDSTDGQRTELSKKSLKKMQKMNIIDIRTDVLCIDSTSIKVHPDASGARKLRVSDVQKVADNEATSLLCF